MSKKVYDCVARVALPSDVDRIVAFYTEHRNHAVYLRERSAIEKSVENELFLIVENPRGQIIAASGIYILADGKPIPVYKSDDADKQIKWGVVTELGSVLRWQGGLPENKRYSGPWHPFLITVPMILLHQRVGGRPAGQATHPQGDLPIDYLVGDIQVTERGVRARLQGDVELTPLHWKLITQPTPQLEEAFKATTKDSNAKKQKDFFLGPVNNLPEVAKYLQKTIRYGMTNMTGDVLSVDMSDLVKRWTTFFTREEGLRVTVLDRIVKNAAKIERHKNIRWKEWGDQFGEIAPHHGLPLRNINNGYHERPTLFDPSAGATEETTNGSGRVTLGDTNMQERVASYHSVRPATLWDTAHNSKKRIYRQTHIL